MREKITENKKRNIWIIEDNAHFRKTIEYLINNARGMECKFAFDSSEEALDKLREEESPDIILLDINLPGMNGIAAIERIKNISPQTHIIILSVYDDNEKVFNALCSGASGYLLKDSSPTKIIESIEEALAGGAPMSIQIAHRVLEIFSKLKPQKSDYGLTSREKEILQLLVYGMSRQQIAEKLSISYHTVTTHLKNIYSKLHVNSKSSAVLKAYKENIL